MDRVIVWYCTLWKSLKNVCSNEGEECGEVEKVEERKERDLQGGTKQYYFFFYKRKRKEEI